MNTSGHDAAAACSDCLKRFFSNHKHLVHLQGYSDEVLRLLVAAGVQLTGSPASWAAGIVYAVANDAKRPCGVSGILNADFERAFGVTMSTVRKRVGAVQRAEVLCRLDATPRAATE